jgi:hypothetical protein
LAADVVDDGRLLEALELPLCDGFCVAIAPLRWCLADALWKFWCALTSCPNAISLPSSTDWSL